jgi:transcriptional/translational regulatory protein YebC/TACO1
VSYLFSRKGVVIVPKGSLTEDDVLTAVLDAGAEEVNDLGEAFEVVSAAGDVVAVRTALQEQGIDYESADTSFLPSMSVEVDEDTARKVFRLIDVLEDNDDVQNVYVNADVPDAVLELLDI